MKYKVPKSIFSEEDRGAGTCEFKKILNDKFVEFNYSAELESAKTSAKGIFTFDEKAGIYRYWWFEDSGAFMSASCNFIDESILSMNWHNSRLVLTFKKISGSTVMIHMKYPSDSEKYDVVFEVILTRG